MKRAKDRNGKIIMKSNTNNNINNIDALDENDILYIDSLPLTGKRTCFRTNKEYIINCKNDALSYSKDEMIEACESMYRAISLVDMNTVNNNKEKLENLSSDVILLYVCKHILYNEPIPFVTYEAMCK